MKPSFTNVIFAAGWGAAGELLAGELLGSCWLGSRWGDSCRALRGEGCCGPAGGWLLRPCRDKTEVTAALRTWVRAWLCRFQPQQPATSRTRPQLPSPRKMGPCCWLPSFPAPQPAAPQLSGSPASSSPAFRLPSLLPPTYKKTASRNARLSNRSDRWSGCLYCLRKLRGIQI